MSERGGPGAFRRGARRVAVAAGLVVGAAVLVLAVLLTLTEGPFGPARGPVVATLSVAEALSGGRLEGFARAEAPRAFVFPRDHGPHPEFRVEWWYWTGNLRSAGGRHLGFQLTFFRRALTPDAPAPWLGLGRQPGLSGAPGGDGRARRPLPLRDADQPRRARPGRRPGGALPRLRGGLGGAERRDLHLSPAPARGRTRTWRWTSTWRAPSRRCCRVSAGSRARDRSPATPRTTTRSRACPCAAPSGSAPSGSRWRGSRGWTASGAPPRWARTWPAGTGSRCSSRTGAS